MTSEDSNLSTDGLTRRQFLAVAGAAAALPALGLAQAPATAGAAPAGPKIRLGLIGCGGRGVWIAKLFKQHGGYELVAGADYFQDRVDNFAKQLGVPAERCFTGLDGYKKLVALKDVDAVAIIAPPFFRPEHVAGALAAGKHVYSAKPLAVDIPGCKSIAESGKAATGNKKVLLVDFQTRANPFYQEALKRVHAGALGEPCFGHAAYLAGRLGAQGEDKTPEGRLRNWVFDVRLSGDIIVEQNIHCLDVMNWVMGQPPLQVTGTGGRKSRVDVGDCWDHYACVYQYPGNIGITFHSRQYNGFGSHEGIIMEMQGTKGVLETNYGGNVLIRGGAGNFYRGGASPDIYTSGAVANIASFHKAVSEGDFTNPTVAPSVQSTMIAVMGRMATRLNKTVTWQELLASTEKVDGDLKGLKA